MTDSSELYQSELLFDMSRLNKKKIKERNDKDVLDAMFLGNVTCTSVEINYHLTKNNQKNIKKHDESDKTSMTLNEIDKIFDRKLELLMKLDQRIDANLIKISIQLENSRFKALLK